MAKWSDRELERRGRRERETLGLGQRAARYQSIRGEECDSPHWRVDKFLFYSEKCHFQETKEQGSPTIHYYSAMQNPNLFAAFLFFRCPHPAHRTRAVVDDGSLSCLHCHNETCSRTQGTDGGRTDGAGGGAPTTHLSIPYPFARPGPFNLSGHSRPEAGGRRSGRK